MELFTLFTKERLASAEAAKNFFRHTSQFLKGPILRLSGGRLNCVQDAISEDNGGAITRWRAVPFFKDQMVFGQELIRFERLANQRYTITESHRLLNLARYDADRGLVARSGGLDVFPARVLANSIRGLWWHRMTMKQA